MSRRVRRPDTESVEGKLLRVYWNARHRVYFGKYKQGDAWKMKTIPVDQDTEEKALRWFTEWTARLSATGVAPVNDEVKIDPRKTIRSLADRWLAWKKEQFGPDAKSYKGCKRLLDKWIFPHRIADVDLEGELNLGLCTNWIEWVKKAGRAPYTTRNIVQGLRGFLVDARGKGWVALKENPMLDPYIKKLMRGADSVAGKNTIVHLKLEEVTRLFTCESRHIPGIRRVRNVLAITTGCRLGEIGAWTWEDVDLDAKIPTMRVFRQVQFSGVEGAPILKDPKKKSHRVLPLHPLAVDALRWWKATGWREHVGVDAGPSDPIFPNPTGEFTVSRYAMLLRVDLAYAGVPVLFDGKHPITFHACRRTFMTLLEAAGVPREVIGALAGHSSKTVADRHYIAKNLVRFRDAISLLPLGERFYLPGDAAVEAERLSA